MTTILDPTGGVRAISEAAYAPRLAGLSGSRVALIDNGKPNARVLLSAIATALQSRGVLGAEVFVKPDVGVPVSPTDIDEIRQVADFAVSAIGDCGSCSAGTASDSVVLERQGIPAVSICTQPFAVTAKAIARMEGVPDFEFLLTRHPIASLDAAAIDQRAAELAEQIERVVTEQR